jgi:DNA-binding protein H-NS
MASLPELLAQKAALDEQITRLKREERSKAVEEARALVEAYELSADEIFGAGSSRKPRAKKESVAAKYRNPATGETWSGRGRSPKWLAGHDKATFAL